MGRLLVIAAMAEEVEEEMMALEAIFYDSFSKIDDRRFRLRIDPNSGNDDTSDPGGPPALFLEILLPDGYPQVIPEFDISNLNNMNYSEAAKRAILEGLHSQDHGSENMDALSQPDARSVESSKKDAKEKLSKSQKRRYFDRFGAGGEKPRGWNWVSIISHLSQVPQHGPPSG